MVSLSCYGVYPLRLPKTIPANKANPTARAANPASFISRIRHLEGAVACKPLEIALPLQAMEVVGPLGEKLLFADQPDQQRHVGGKLLRPQVDIEEVDGEDESRGQQRLRRMDHLGHVQRDAGQEQQKKAGNQRIKPVEPMMTMSAQAPQKSNFSQ